MQQTSTTSVLTNWVSITLRWLTLLVIALSLSFGSRFTLAVGIVLISAALWNVWLSVWLLLKQQRFAHKLVLIAVDMLTVYVLFAMSGTLGGGLGWTGILPIITASLMYGLLGAAAVIPINLVVQGLLSLLDGDLYTVGLFILTLLPIYLIAGAVFGFIGQRMLRIREQEARALVRTRLEAQRTERERSRVIYNLISTLSSSLNYQRVLETSLDLSASAMEKIDDRHDQLVSGVLLFVADESGGTYLQVGSARRFTQADLRLTLQGRQGAIGKAIDGGNPQLTRVISQDPELGMIVAMRVCQAVYIVPLRVGLDNYGVMVFGHPEEKYFTPERTEVLDIVGNQSVIAIQNARLYSDLEQEQERILEIQEDARNKLARDLHDGPTQSVAAIAMRVNFARRLIERNVKAAAEELYKVEDLARQTTKEIRHMLFTLRPLVLESQGLIPALESMADKMRDTYDQNVIVMADPHIVSQMEDNKQGVVFYITEEAVNNARKHAEASHIWVRLHPLEAGLAILEIEDDGGGFDLEDVDSDYEKRGSLGMINMRERAELVNGRVKIDSALGRGTRVSVIIPLNEDAIERVRRTL